jgi:tetratricopeptide (TPR) repeat protein
VRPLINKEDNAFNVMERGVLLGILAGYFTHNLVVFDNIVSYIFFAIILALITSRVGVVPKKIANFKIDTSIVNQFAIPVVSVVLVAGIYFFHVPGMTAAEEIINGFRESDPIKRMELFEKALAENSFAHQEITEQLSQQAIGIVRNQEISEEVKNLYAFKAEEQLAKLVEEKPGDARIHVFIGSYYRAIGNNEKAAEQMALARKFSPKKQSIIIQQGFIALALSDTQGAHDFFKVAFTLDERNLEAREYYAASLFYLEKNEEVSKLMEADGALARFARSDFLIGTANQFGQSELVIKLFEYRANTEPDGRQKWQEQPQTWASLAYLYYKSGNNERAIEVLNEGKEAIPSFAGTAACFVDNIESGKDPQEGC